MARMITKLSVVTILVRNQDEALQWYTEKLGLEKRVDDSTTVPGYRWLTVGPRGQKDLEMVLQRPRSTEGMESVGKQPGPKSQPEAAWVFETDDCKKTYEEMKTKGVKFLGEPVERPYGVEAGFEDLYGNIYYMIQPRHWEMPAEEKKPLMAEA